MRWHLRDLVALFADEAFYAGNPRTSASSIRGRPAAFDAFSGKSSKYSPAAVNERWTNFGRWPPRNTGIGKLLARLGGAAMNEDRDPEFFKEIIGSMASPPNGPAAGDYTDDPQTSFDRTLAMLCSYRDIDKACVLFNTKYAVVNEAGKAMVYEQVIDPLRKRKLLLRITYEDLKKLYQNRKITIETTALVRGKRVPKETTRSAAEWWLDYPDRRSYIGGVIFDPSEKAPASYWNLWSGFEVTPAPGDWSLMQDHVYRVVCGGDARDVEYLLGLAARMYQQPHLPGEVVTVLRGPEGSGKGIFLRYLVRGWGQHGLQITNAQHLVGNFNGHLRDLVALFADEAFYAGNPRHISILKGVITEPAMAIEDKYRTVVEVANMLHIWMASDTDWVVPVSLRDRRFFVRDVSDHRVNDRPYFNAMAEQMENGGLAAMIWDLLHRDLGNFEFRDIPRTAAMKMQQTLSLSSLQRWWLAVLQRGFLWKSRHGAPWFTDWHEFYTTELLVRSYNQWCDEHRPLDRKSREQLGTFLSELYVPSRPRGEHPVFEIDSIDRNAVDAITDPNTGNVKMVAKPLDVIAIVYKTEQYGYRVGEMQIARARFLDHCDVDNPWNAPV